ncbi:MAG: retropepsin-like aspartic protease family protein [Francisellaceae bacterium]
MQKKFIYAFWLAVFTLGIYIAHVFLQAREMKTLTPESTIYGNSKTVRLKSYNNQYMSYGKINGIDVKFIIDTGASSVSIPKDVADKIGLRKGQAYRAMTANGEITVYYTRLDSLSIGAITLNDINASINPSSTDDYVLLGMSALKRLKMVHEGNSLILQS